MRDRWNLWFRLTRYRCWKGPKGERIDGTNNACERAIGWWIKEWYRSMRGYSRSRQCGTSEPSACMEWELPHPRRCRLDTVVELKKSEQEKCWAFFPLNTVYQLLNNHRCCSTYTRTASNASCPSGSCLPLKVFRLTMNIPCSTFADTGAKLSRICVDPICSRVSSISSLSLDLCIPPMSAAFHHLLTQSHKASDNGTLVSPQHITQPQWVSS